MSDQQDYVNQDITEEAPNNKSVVALVGVLVIIVAAVLWFWPSEPSEPEFNEVAVSIPEPQPEPESVQQEPVEELIEEPVMQQEPEVIEPVEAVVEPEPLPEVILPDLDESDEVIAKEVKDSPLSYMLDWLVTEDLIRRVVIFTDNAAQRELAKNHHLVKGPSERFAVSEQGDKTFIHPKSFERYDALTNAIIAMPVDDLMKMFEKYQPLMQKAYAEIGYPDDNFTDTIEMAIDHLLDTPDTTGPHELVQPHVMYEYADAGLQSLSAVQKQLLRTGPDNMAKLKAKLRNIKKALPL